MKALLKHPFACFDLWSVGLQRLGGDLEFVTVEVLFGGVYNLPGRLCNLPSIQEILFCGKRESAAPAHMARRKAPEPTRANLRASLNPWTWKRERLR